MKAYIAFSPADSDRARRCIAALRDHGVDIAHDATVDAVRFAPGEAPPNSRAQAATAALDGVVAADVVLVLLSSDRAFLGDPPVEMGAALVLSIPVVLAGAARNRSRFADLCTLAKSDAEGIDAVLKLCGMGRVEARSA